MQRQKVCIVSGAEDIKWDSKCLKLNVIGRKKYSPSLLEKLVELQEGWQYFSIIITVHLTVGFLDIFLKLVLGCRES